MAETNKLPSYSEIAGILQKIQPNCHLSQLHGLLSGHACAQNEEEVSLWQAVLPEAPFDESFNEVLKDLYEVTYKSLEEFSFEFELLLPDDSTDINLRAEALGLWCQGILTGLTQSGVDLSDIASEELQEAIDDMVEISNISFGDIETENEDETAYFELMEYIRLSALMIFNELRVERSKVVEENPQNLQ